jgi:hypothetical protein
MSALIGHEHDCQTAIRLKRERTDVPWPSIALYPRKQFAFPAVTMNRYFEISVSAIPAFQNPPVHEDRHGDVGANLLIQ